MPENSFKKVKFWSDFTAPPPKVKLIQLFGVFLRLPLVIKMPTIPQLIATQMQNLNILLGRNNKINLDLAKMTSCLHSLLEIQTSIILNINKERKEEKLQELYLFEIISP